MAGIRHLGLFYLLHVTQRWPGWKLISANTLHALIRIWSSSKPYVITYDLVCQDKGLVLHDHCFACPMSCLFVCPMSVCGSYDIGLLLTPRLAHSHMEL